MMKTKSSHALTAVSAMFSIEKQKSSAITRQKKSQRLYIRKNNYKKQHNMHQSLQRGKQSKTLWIQRQSH